MRSGTTDESRFCLGLHEGRQRVRCFHGARRQLRFQRGHHVARTVGIMVWDAIRYGRRSRLLFTRGSMTAQRSVLHPVLVPYIRRGATAFPTE
jgi:hypothetical protein